MTRRLAAALSALALALCYARVGSWAGGSIRGAHSCCGRDAPAKSSTLTDCCLVSAAAGAVHIVRVDAPAILAALPLPHDSSVSFAFAPEIALPWNGRADRAAAPARAPPLA